MYEFKGNRQLLKENPLDSLKSLLERVTENDTCETALQKLYDEINRLSDGQNIAASILELFDSISKQQNYDGFLLNMSGVEAQKKYTEITGSTEVGAGGGGWAWRPIKGNIVNVGGKSTKGVFDAVVWISNNAIDPSGFSRPYTTSEIQRQVTHNAYHQFLTLVHELLHAGRKEGTHSHKLMDQAAINLDPSLVTDGFIPTDQESNVLDDYVSKYCVPEEFGKNFSIVVKKKR